MKALHHHLKLVNYQPQHQPYFERFNKDWIEKYFKLEPIDVQVLENPDEHILKPGGAILVAELENQPVGVVALKKLEEGIFEMTKMAVADRWQGRKFGQALGEGILEKAQEMKAQKVILYSQTNLNAAVNMYRKLGFQESRQIDGVYARCNIKMEIDFARHRYLQEQAQQLHRTVDVFLNKTIRLGIAWHSKKEFRKWSPIEIIGHLIDSAANNHQRFIFAQAGNALHYPAYNQDFWVSTHNYFHLPTEQLLEFWRQYNYFLCEVIKNIRYEALDVPCTIGDAQPVPLRTLIEDYQAHLQHHLSQIVP
ncbi:GNAT family N-acetyltransferase [Cytophagales bacterium LB-30]|uniref:GNAT family N-acetyltransferase n=1 Tax=Shiella aurantiaca TaxID=3058365 RepID=A0ABT8F1Z0_9BACT|nr:GNAT family N-acetyltransferase [Shiella aurantiaca]MDN4164461.1 GNAT family N-acetyltransferase [Shiella aurantiaca]